LRGVYAGLSREETVAQAVPQDAVFRLAGGRIERIECPQEFPS
jgi:probable phosphoglycerate mutase